MMDNTTNRKKLQKRITIANIINSIFTALLCLMEIPVGVAIKYCQDTIVSLMDGVQNADAESFIGGYQVIGGLFGAGAVTIVVGVLYLILAVIILYLVAFLAENISGYRIASRSKKEAYSEALVKKIKRNAIFKCVLALLIIIPGAYFVFSAQWYGMLVMIIPQVVVMVLAINIIRMLPDSADLIEPRMSMREGK